MKMLLLAMGVSQTWDCEGKVDAELKVQGEISDFESLLPSGEVKFHSWTILSNNKIAAEEVNGVLIVDGRHLKLTRCYGRLCDGNLHCSLDVNINMSAPVAFLGDLQVTDINMLKLTELLPGNRKFTRGTGFLNMRFTADTSGIGSLNGNGILRMNDVDLMKIPIIGEMFKRIGSEEYQLARLSDAEVVFGLSALQMTIERGHMSNLLSAIEVEPGGKINLQNGQVDIYVIALPIKQISKLLVGIPVVNWFANFQNKLLRLRLKGRLSQPPGELISKQPLTDIKEGTIGFFVDVVQSGGQLIQKTQKKKDL